MYMPELPEWFSFTSARNSQFSHSRAIQNKWLAGPSPVIAPPTTFQLSGLPLAFHPFSVLPSNMEIQPSLAAAPALDAAPAPEGTAGTLWALAIHQAAGSTANASIARDF